MPQGIPDGPHTDANADANERMVRSFLVVRMVRSSVLLVFLAVALLGVEANHWPSGIAVAVGLTLLLQAATLTANWRRFRSS